MASSPKTYNIFSLIRLLLTSPSKDLRQLSKALEVGSRTVRRYLDELEYIGFPIQKDNQKYHLERSVGLPIDLDYGLSMMEMEFFKNAMQSAADSPLRNSIVKKVFKGSDYHIFSESFVKMVNQQVMRDLDAALSEKRQIKLVNYHSLESNTKTTRTVEPLEFASQYTQIRCYEPASGIVKNFKVERMEKIEILPQHRTYNGEVLPTDAFGMSSDKVLPIQMALTQKAYMLLTEEFPLTAKDIWQHGQSYCYDGTVQDFRPIARFVLGLADEIQVIGSEEFLTFLRDKVKKIQF